MALPADVRTMINLRRSAYLQVDMQRRHLDPEVGYHLVAEGQRLQVLQNARRCLQAARRARLPVIHVGTWSRHPSPWGPIDRRNPFWEWQAGRTVPGLNRPRQTGRNVEGSVYAEFMPELAPLPGEPVIVKRRYSAFYGTDLELVLRGLGAETVFICGVNTNNCVLATVFDAFSRDFRVVVVADACGSMNGEDYHRFALMEIEAALGFTATTEEFCELLGLGAR
jgi:ureidoacrylate peracid hydrolase